MTPYFTWQVHWSADCHPVSMSFCSGTMPALPPVLVWFCLPSWNHFLHERVSLYFYLITKWKMYAHAWKAYSMHKALATQGWVFPTPMSLLVGDDRSITYDTSIWEEGTGDTLITMPRWPISISQFWVQWETLNHYSCKHWKKKKNSRG